MTSTLQRPTADTDATHTDEAFHAPSRAVLAAVTLLVAAALTAVTVAAPRAGAGAGPVLLAGFAGFMGVIGWLLWRYRADPFAAARPGATVAVAIVGYWAAAALSMVAAG
jgi:hypothetical protein